MGGGWGEGGGWGVVGMLVKCKGAGRKSCILVCKHSISLFQGRGVGMKSCILVCKHIVSHYSRGVGWG